MFYPLIHRIPYQSPTHYLAALSSLENTILLESAQQRPHCGRYSFIGYEPFLTLFSKNGQITLGNAQLKGNPFILLKEQLTRFPLLKHPDLPPFQGGVAGFFSYDLYQHLENISTSQLDSMEFPDMALGFYDLVIAFDHELEKSWIISSGYPEREADRRIERAKTRIKDLLLSFKKIALPDEVNPKVSTPTANFTKTDYCKAVEKTKNYILAGDIFQANLSQCFTSFLSDPFSAFALYLRLREINPAPFAAFIQLGDCTLVSASPERFIKLTGRNVETRPIKGTARRGDTPEDDAALAAALVHREKDRAENIMIVDLLRNDLSRVCLEHSVKVPQLCGLESYATVHHLVSIVIGELRKQHTAIDLMMALFPGGSITGAPKIRAMEIIAELEPTRRGPYCGSIGYIGFDGDMDTSITIRTYAIRNQKITFQAGGAIILDSNPEAEYAETHIKVQALHRALS